MRSSCCLCLSPPTIFFVFYAVCVLSKDSRRSSHNFLLFLPFSLFLVLTVFDLLSVTIRNIPVKANKVWYEVKTQAYNKEHAPNPWHRIRSLHYAIQQ
jgi:hypothetical protein